MYITEKQAFALLAEGISDPRSVRYVMHSVYVGELAALIAGRMGLDPVYAAALGYLHDIGRKVDPANHMYAGYKYLKQKGYGEYAYICLTHSFLNNDIECICGELLSPQSEGYAEVKELVSTREYTDYDRIIQTCDLLCLHSGGTTLEERIADIESRKGTHAKSAYHRRAAFAQLEYIESRIGCPVYDMYKYLKGDTFGL